MDPFIPDRHFAQRVAEYRGVAGHCSGNRFDPFGLVEFADTVVFGPVLLGESIPFSLAGQGVYQNGATHPAHCLERADHQRQIMAVDRSEIFETELFKEDVGHHELLQAFLDSTGQQLCLAAVGNLAEQIPQIAFQTIVMLATGDAGQIAGNRADVGRNTHLVVIEDHDQTGLGLAGVVQPLVRQSPGQCTIPQNGHDRVILASGVTRQRKTKCGADRGTGMPHPEHVVRAFRLLGKTGDAIPGPESFECSDTPRQQLVGIGLMSDIPNDFIDRSLKNTV